MKMITMLKRKLARKRSHSYEFSKNDPLTKSSPLRKGISSNELAQFMGMDYERFSHLLPYRYFDDDDQLFINTESMGFALEVMPLSGANEEIIHSISDMIKNKLDHTVCVQVMLVGGNKLSPLLSKLAAGYGQFDEMFKQLGMSQYRYLKHAALYGFHNKKKMNLPLRDYRCFVFINKRGGYTPTQAERLCELRDDVTIELKNAGLSNEKMNAVEMIALLKSLINIRSDEIKQEGVKLDQYKELHEQIVDPSFNLKIYPNHLESHVANSERADIVALSLRTLPDEVALWTQADNFSNMLKPSIGIPCPFVISLHFKCEPKEKSKLQALRKANGYEKKANSPYAKLIPGTVQAAADWKKIRDDLAADAIQLCKVHYNCILFTNALKRREHVSQTIATFRSNGLDLYAIKYQQLQSYLALFPFVVEQGLWNDLSLLGRLNTMTTWNLANMLPLVADYKGCQNGMGFFAPTFRYQAACINNFDTRLDNYNCCIAATSGSGKSVLAQSIISSVLAQNGQVWVIDMGESYKKFCETLGGTYMDASTLRLNPFSNVRNITESEEAIRDLIAVMASPYEGLSDVQKAHLLNAVNDAYRKKKNNANIDDIINYLSSIDKTKKHDLRINDMITLLGKYSPTHAPKGSISARVFNEKSLLSTDDMVKQRFIVLELTELEKQPELLKSVLFALILNIENKMYCGDRHQKKLCIIDEAWRLLKGSNRSACDFIDKGFRTARKNNAAFVVISQKINDFHMNEEAKAAWSCSENKIIMRQNNEAFEDFLNGKTNYFNDYETQIIKHFMPSQSNGFSEFMVRQGNITSFHRLFLDPFSRVMYSSRAEEHQAIQAMVDNGVPIAEAIQELAHALYGDEIKAIDQLGT